MAPILPIGFFGLWLGPLFLLGGMSMWLGHWTPLAPASRGDWSRFMLSDWAALLCGFFWEMWNHGARLFHPVPSANPNYWVYEVPYVGVLKVFEMPLLGYFGYLPFGVICWVLWAWAARLFDWEPDFVPEEWPESRPATVSVVA